MEIVSQIDTKNGLEMVMNIQGQKIKKVFSYEQLNSFIEKEENNNQQPPPRVNRKRTYEEMTNYDQDQNTRDLKRFKKGD